MRNSCMASTETNALVPPPEVSPGYVPPVVVPIANWGVEPKFALTPSTMK